MTWSLVVGLEIISHVLGGNCCNIAGKQIIHSWKGQSLLLTPRIHSSSISCYNSTKAGFIFDSNT